MADEQPDEVRLYEISTGELRITLHLPIGVELAATIMELAAAHGMGFEHEIDEAVR